MSGQAAHAAAGATAGRETEAVLRVDGLRKTFPVTRGALRRSRGQVRAVDGVSFDVAGGRTLALVGESGSGKSTVARCLLRLVEPDAGSVVFQGADVRRLGGEQLRAYRRRVQIVFQDPFGTLNPRMTVEQLLSEPMLVHRLVADRAAARERVASLLQLVGLSADQAARYPHEFSGGQRQRIAIARALALEPAVIILDEPVAALDVSIGAQILNLLADLQQRLNVAYLLISHDLSLVRHVAHNVAVMYLGAIVETAPTARLFGGPQHPYTQALLSAVPVPDPRAERERRRLPLPGEVPDGLHIPPACRFHPRCFKAEPVCSEQAPALAPVVGDDHRAACWFAEPLDVLQPKEGSRA